MGRIGGGELLLIALIAILLFGASRLSDIGKGLGEGIKNFKKGLKDDSGDDEKKPADAKAADEKPVDEAKKS
jgi:sec-independent protein translocase protein TatA